jgi:hypothetical protein
VAVRFWSFAKFLEAFLLEGLILSASNHPNNEALNPGGRAVPAFAAACAPASAQTSADVLRARPTVQRIRTICVEAALILLELAFGDACGHDHKRLTRDHKVGSLSASGLDTTH